MASLNERVKQLEAREKDLMDRYMAFCRDAYDRYAQANATQEPPKAPSYSDPIFGLIESIEAKDEAEEKEKKQALEQVQQMVGH